MLAKFPGEVAALDGAPARRGPDPVAGATGGPHHPAPRDLKAIEALLQRGNMARALAEGQRLALMFPASAALHNLLGIDFGKAGKLEDAVREFRRTAELDPGNSGVQLNMANALMALGRFGEAADAAGAAHAAAPGLGPVDGRMLVRFGTKREWVTLEKGRARVVFAPVAPGVRKVRAFLQTGQTAYGAVERTPVRVLR